MEAEEADRGQLLGPGEIGEVIAIVAGAGIARAPLDDRLAAPLPARFAQVEAKAILRVGYQRRPMSGEAGRDRAVEYVETERDAVEQIVDVADPQQVLGRGLGQQRRGQRQHAAHLLLVAPERAADRDAVDPRLRDDPGGVASQVLMDTALDDPEDGLVPGAVLLVPGQAAAEPAVGALHRTHGVLAVGVVGRALVEDEGDVGPELRLHVHRDLGRDEELRPVPIGAETGALLVDPHHGAMGAAPGPAAPLDLVGDAAVGEREDLEPAGVGDQGAIPAHEIVQPAGGVDPLGTGRDEQVVGVAENQVVADPGDLVRVERADGPLGSERDEGRCLHRPVGCFENPRPGGTVAGADLRSSAAAAQPSSSNERPLIAAGCEMPSSCRAVGATSARIPPERSSSPSSVTISGTGFSEWAVFGDPSGSSMWSQLP